MKNQSDIFDNKDTAKQGFLSQAEYFKSIDLIS